MLAVCSKSVLGGASEWAVACSALEAVRSAAKARNAKLVVVVVGSAAELPEERVGAISRIGAIEKRFALCCHRISWLACCTSSTTAVFFQRLMFA